MELYQHQKELIALDPLRCLIAWGTGGGKTLTAAHLSKGFTLIICPKTLKHDGTWDRAMKQAGKEKKSYIVFSKEEFRIQFKKDPHSFPKVECLIVDEAHTVAGVTPYTKQKHYEQFPKTSQIFDAVFTFSQNLLKQNENARIYLLTATPDSEPIKVFALARILGKKSDFFRFRDMFYIQRKMRQRTIFIPNRSTGNKMKMAKIIKKIGVVGRLEDWFDVPDQIEKDIFCSLSAEQEKRKREIPVLFPDPLAHMLRSHQMEQGISVNPLTLEQTIIAETKCKQIEDLVDEFGSVLVFARYTEQIQMYKLHFARKIDTRVYTLTGKTKDKERETICKEANESAKNGSRVVFIAQSQMSAGWELPDFKGVTFGSATPSFVDYEQAKGRVQRANNIKKNVYVHLIAGEIDKKLRKIIKEKKTFSDAKFAEMLIEDINNKK